MSAMKLQARSGLALVNVLVFAIFTTAFLVAGIQFTTQAMKAGRKSKSNAQVYNVALAGITHATFWMQKQNVQPVEVFDPRSVSLTAFPDEENETKADEQQLGLVSEFVIDAGKSLWGRYEVGRSASQPNPAPTRSGVSIAGPGSPLYSPGPITWTAEDISAQRGAMDKPGSIWRIRSRAYVFQRKVTTDAFSPTGNPTPIQDVMTLEAEVKSSPMKFRQAALYGWGAGLSSVDVDFVQGSDGTEPLINGAGAKGYQLRTGDLSGQDYELTLVSCASNPAPDTTISSSLADHLQYVFGVGSASEVEYMANNVYTAVTDVPLDQPPMSLLYMKGKSSTNFTFNAGKPLNGGGILFVAGNLTIDGASALQSWDGLVIVTGDFTLKNTATITGSVMVGGHVKMDADSGKQPRILYSPDTLANVGQALGAYRMERSTIRSVDDASTTYSF